MHLAIEILLAYIILVFLVIRLVVPFYGFKKPLIPALPPNVKETITILQNKSTNKETYLHAAYEFRKSRWHTELFKTLIAFPLAFRKNIGTLWNSPGFAHCNTMNFILYVLLLEGKYFNQNEIRFRYTIRNLFIHQYLQVKIKDNWINIDTSDNVALGEKGKFFN